MTWRDFAIGMLRARAHALRSEVDPLSNGFLPSEAVQRIANALRGAARQLDTHADLLQDEISGESSK